MTINNSGKKTWRYQAVSLALGLTLLGSVAGCSSPEESQPAVSNSASVSLPYANNGVAVNNGKGSYLQTTVDDNDPAVAYDSSKSSVAVKSKYSDEQLAEAQKAVVKFIAEQTIDSTVQGGGNPEEWLEKNKQLIAPDFQEKVKSLVADPKSGFLIDNPNRKSAEYDLKYSETEPRVASRSIEVTKIDLASKDRPIVSANIEYKLKADNGKFEKASGTVSYAVTEEAGKWLISGYDSKIAISPFASE